MTSSTAAASATVRVSGPAMSCVRAAGMIPLRLTSPRVGRSPTGSEAGARPVETVGLFERARVDEQKGVQLRPCLVVAGDAIQVMLRERARGQRAGGHRRLELREARFFDPKRRAFAPRRRMTARTQREQR